MAENTNNEAPRAQLLIQKVYVKDSSFEAPNTPQVFQSIAQSKNEPQIQLNLGHQVTSLGENIDEIVLTVTVTCTLDERNVYLAEVHQAGIFTISGFGKDERANIIGSYCPNLLFPYARHIISGMIQEGGFPPFLLQPINFDALYAEQQRKAQAELDSKGNGQTE